MNATALIRGDTVEVWAPTQSPSIIRGVAARVAGTTPDKVQVTTTLLGGGFGRKAEGDFIIDAVSLARAVQGRPVKVIWSREDDVSTASTGRLRRNTCRSGSTPTAISLAGGTASWRSRSSPACFGAI